MKARLRRSWLTGAAVAICFFWVSGLAPAQTSVKPGKSVEAEFTAKEQTHTYTVQLSAGDRLIVVTEPVGETIGLWLTVFDPADKQVGSNNGYRHGKSELTTVKVSARGTYRVAVNNGSSVGEYTISIGKIDRSGETIAPGSGTGGATGSAKGHASDATLESLLAELKALREEVKQLRARVEKLEGK